MYVPIPPNINLGHWIGSRFGLDCMIMLAIATNHEDYQFISRFKIQFHELHNLQDVTVKILFLFDYHIGPPN